MNSGLAASFIKRFAGGPAIQVENLATTKGAAITVLFGASGSGKSTVLRCLAGLERPDEGNIRLNDADWFDASRRFFLPPRARHVGFVPQDYALFPHLTVAQNIAYGLDQMTPRECRQRVGDLLDWLDLSQLDNRLPRELSGGQQQRVALARAVARRPRLLLLDEPLSALDTPTRMRLRGELRSLLRQLAVPTLLVTHDRQEALSLADDLVIMDGGCMVQQGPAAEVFSRPKSLAAAGILAVETIVPGRVLHCADGLAMVSVQQIQLTALTQDLPVGASEVYVCIRAEDVILTLNADTHSSPRNRLSGVVQRLEPDGPLLRVSVECGFTLLALLTKPACEELALQPGSRVHAWIKAPQIHLIPHAVSWE